MGLLRSWREQKILLKRLFPFLMDEDFEYEEGAKEGMLNRLANKLKKTDDELQSLFADLQKF